jgi:hypothetical protein
MKPQGYAFDIVELPNKNIHKWIPGELDGIKVPVRMIVPMIIDRR